MAKQQQPVPTNVAPTSAPSVGPLSTMTPQQLSDDLRAASLAEFGDTGVSMYPSTYFNHDVKVIAPNGSTTPRAPKYCATPFSATQLAGIFKPQAIVLGNAANFTGLLQSWSDSELVPYLQFKNGVVNAGLLLDYFNHGFPIGQVMESCLAEIKGVTK